MFSSSVELWRLSPTFGHFSFLFRCCHFHLLFSFISITWAPAFSLLSLSFTIDYHKQINKIFTNGFTTNFYSFLFHVCLFFPFVAHSFVSIWKLCRRFHCWFSFLVTINFTLGKSFNEPSKRTRPHERKTRTEKKWCRAIKIMIFFSFLNKFEKSPSNQKNDKRPENRQQTTTGKRNSLHWHEFHSKEHSLNITFRLISNWMLFYSSSKSERASARANTNIFHSFFLLIFHVKWNNRFVVVHFRIFNFCNFLNENVYVKRHHNTPLQCIFSHFIN